MRINLYLMLAACLLAVAGCKPEEQIDRAVATPEAYRAEMQLPGQCGLNLDYNDIRQRASHCIVQGDVGDLRAGRTSAVIGYFDDEIIPDSWGGPSEWADRHDHDAKSEMLMLGSHNGTDAVPVAIAPVPQARWPAGADFCGRTDWEGREQSHPDLTISSREYTCYRQLPTQGGFQFVQVEIMEYRPDGRPAAAIDPRGTADAVFASLRLGGG